MTDIKPSTAETVTLKTYCPHCDAKTLHLSQETTAPAGERYETITCTECGHQKTIQVL